MWKAWTSPKVRREWVATLTPETEVDWWLHIDEFSGVRVRLLLLDFNFWHLSQ